MPSQTASSKVASAKRSVVGPSKGRTTFDPTQKYTPYATGGTIDGYVAPGWDGVQDAFSKNFADGQEVQAQLCITRGDGESLVDLMGVNSSVAAAAASNKSADEYTLDTVQPIWSCGKNLEVLIVAILVDRGLVQYDDPICKHWPAFAKQGKEGITIADLMRHSAGMAYFVDPEDPDNKFKQLTAEDIMARTPMHELIENSPPQQFGKSKRTYHTVSRGFVVDGLLKHVDPEGRTIGEFARDEILKPLGIDDSYFVALPTEEAAKISVANLCPPHPAYSMHFDFGPAMMGAGTPDMKFILQFLNPTSVANRCQLGVRGYNDDDPQATGIYMNSDGAPARIAECTSAWSFASARALTKVLSVFTNGGVSGGTRLISEESALKALDKMIFEVDEFSSLSCEFSQGGIGNIYSLMKDFGFVPEDTVAAYKGWIGWFGYGGSFNFTNIEEKITVSYTITGMGIRAPDPRGLEIMKAVAEVLEQGTPQ